VVDDEFVPWTAVFLGLLAETVGQLVQAIGGHAGDMLALARGLLEGDADGDAGDVVYVADVGVQLVVVEGEFAEAEVDVGVWITGVEHGWLDQGWAGVQEEVELVFYDPDPTAGYLWDLSWSSQRGVRLVWQSQWRTVTVVVLPGEPREMAQSSASGEPIEGGFWGK